MDRECGETGGRNSVRSSIVSSSGTAEAMSTVTDGKRMVYPRHAVPSFEDCCICANAEPTFEGHELTVQMAVITPRDVHETSDC